MATVRFYLSTKRSVCSEKQIYVDIVARENGRRIHKRFKTLYSTPEERWNETTQSINIPRTRIASPEQRKETERLNDTNKALAALRADIEKLLLGGFDEVAILALLGQEKKEVPQEVVYFDEGMRRYAQDSDLCVNRKRHYVITANTIQRWMEFSGKRITSSAFTIKELEELATFIENEHTLQASEQYKKRVVSKTDKPVEKQGASTVNQKLAQIKAYVKHLVRIGELMENPFDRFSMRKELYGKPTILDWSEVQQIYEATHLSTKKAIQRDIFVFQCCIGCRVSDLENLTWDNIEVVNGVYYLSYIPKKTSKVKADIVRVALCPMAVEIVERYRNSKGWSLLPCVSTQKYNDSIKEILQDCGIVRKVLVIDPKTRESRYERICDVASSHLARRTSASDLNKRGLTEYDICASTGHAPGSKSLKRYITASNERITAAMLAR